MTGRRVPGRRAARRRVNRGDWMARRRVGGGMAGWPRGGDGWPGGGWPGATDGRAAGGRAADGRAAGDPAAGDRAVTGRQGR